jgi:hypothetical protein
MGKRNMSQLGLNYGLCGKQQWKNSKILTVGDFDDDVNGGHDTDDEENWINFGQGASEGKQAIFGYLGI